MICWQIKDCGFIKIIIIIFNNAWIHLSFHSLNSFIYTISTVDIQLSHPGCAGQHNRSMNDASSKPYITAGKAGAVYYSEENKYLDTLGFLLRYMFSEKDIL